MKMDNLVAGIIVIFFAAILLVDAIQTTYDVTRQLFSPNDVKGMTGIVLLVTAALLFRKAMK